jgi:hypothetical protein
MQKFTVTCDVCGTIIEGKFNKLEIQKGIITTSYDAFSSCDICKKCLSLIENLIEKIKNTKIE